ncbi:hypothetical protein BDW22DRAFT_1357296 [Trametopsis cervina]|nr:hypothetical protein BDW22DRAFT_1357296 [Trametopsis cervina]
MYSGIRHLATPTNISDRYGPFSVSNTDHTLLNHPGAIVRSTVDHSLSRLFAIFYILSIVTVIYALVVMRRLALKKTEYEDITKWNTRVLVARKKKRVQLCARSALKWLAEIREKEAQTCIEGVKRSARLESQLHHSERVLDAQEQEAMKTLGALAYRTAAMEQMVEDEREAKAEWIQRYHEYKSLVQARRRDEAESRHAAEARHAQIQACLFATNAISMRTQVESIARDLADSDAANLALIRQLGTSEARLRQQVDLRHAERRRGQIQACQFAIHAKKTRIQAASAAQDLASSRAANIALTKQCKDYRVNTEIRWQQAANKLGGEEKRVQQIQACQFAIYAIRTRAQVTSIAEDLSHSRAIIDGLTAKLDDFRSVTEAQSQREAQKRHKVRTQLAVEARMEARRGGIQACQFVVYAMKTRLQLSLLTHDIHDLHVSNAQLTAQKDVLAERNATMSETLDIIGSNRRTHLEDYEHLEAHFKDLEARYASAIAERKLYRDRWIRSRALATTRAAHLSSQPFDDYTNQELPVEHPNPPPFLPHSYVELEQAEVEPQCSDYAEHHEEPLGQSSMQACYPGLMGYPLEHQVEAPQDIEDVLTGSAALTVPQESAQTTTSPKQVRAKRRKSRRRELVEEDSQSESPFVATAEETDGAPAVFKIKSAPLLYIGSSSRPYPVSPSPLGDPHAEVLRFKGRRRGADRRELKDRQIENR